MKTNLDEVISGNYAEYGTHVALNRAVPRVDGLKSSHRRILLALKEVASNKFTGTINAIGAAQVKHPYGNQSIEGVIASMVRTGVIDGEGEFGVRLLEDIPAAAPRYTKVGLPQDKLNYYFRFLDYCPEHEGEESIEPEFLIVPVPFSLIYGTMSWGLAIMSRIPAFTYESLLDAYKNNDPYKLRSNYGYKIDQSMSELDSLWNTGQGRLCLKMNVTRVDEDNIMITGSGELFKPKMKLLNKWIEEGQIEYKNNSSTDLRLMISRIPRS